MARVKTLFFRTTFFSLALALAGCSSDSGTSIDMGGSGSQVGANEVTDNGNTGGNDSSNNITSETNPSTIDVTTYTTSLLQVNYPSDWIVDTSNNNIDAAFLSNEINSQGGRNNCVLISSFAPGGSLLRLTEEFLDSYVTTPMPDVSFVTVNGTSMSRISGFLNASTSLKADSQLAYEDENIHALLCLGLTPEELNVFLDSMVVL